MLNSSFNCVASKTAPGNYVAVRTLCECK
jgi:hypothetical protein